MSERELRSIQLTPGASFPATEDAPVVPPGDTIFQDMCRVVRQAYIHCRREHCGKWNYGENGLGKWDGEDKFGTNVAPIWPKVAAHIIRLGADPVTFIRAQFANTRIDQPPLPNQLLSESSVAKYDRYAANAERDLRERLERELDSVQSMVIGLEKALNWEYGRALRYALFNHSEVFAGPVLRYALALEYELPDVADRYRDHALLQYAFQKPFFDRAWDGCIPAQLSKEGQRLVERALM